jgi:hypothetical protein
MVRQPKDCMNKQKIEMKVSAYHEYLSGVLIREPKGDAVMQLPAKHKMLQVRHHQHGAPAQRLQHDAVSKHNQGNSRSNKYNFRVKGFDFTSVMRR